MKTALAVGVLAIVTSGWMVSCGDDSDGSSPTSSSQNTGGMGGVGGIGGNGAGGIGGNGAGGAGAGGAGVGAGGAGGQPPAPTLGPQIDRVGRPAINTMVNRTFTARGTHAAAQDAWNANADPTSWPSSYTADIAADLAIYDGLDALCGNQIASCNTEEANCYNALATMLAHDWLLVKGDATEGCVQYLAAELSALGAIPNDQCGGRHPAMDVVDTTYSAVIIGGVAGVSDGIAAPPQALIDTFPYLSASN